MIRNVILVGIVFLVVVTFSVFTSCRSCSDKRVEDVSDIPGIYKGEATLVLPGMLQGMAKPGPDGKSPIPEDPIPCKVEIKIGENKELVMQLVDFKMPVEGIVLAPSPCNVTQENEVFNMTGKGQVSFGERSLAYSHESKIQGSNLDLEGKISIIPGLLEVKINFKGEKQ